MLWSQWIALKQKWVFSRSAVTAPRSWPPCKGHCCLLHAARSAITATAELVVCSRFEWSFTVVLSDCCCRCWWELWQLMLQKLNSWCLLLTIITKCLLSRQLECALHVTCRHQWLSWSFFAASNVATQVTNNTLLLLLVSLSPVPFLHLRCQKWRKKSLVCTFLWRLIINAY